MTMGQYTKQEGIEILQVAKAKMDAATTKEEALTVLRETGAEVAYSPAFRCLVMGVEPEKSIGWG
jgi:hypothetical protein